MAYDYPGINYVHGTAYCVRSLIRRMPGGSMAAIEIEGLRKSFGQVRALRGVDLAVPDGSVCALLGPNGAGKTTVVRGLATLTRPDGRTAPLRGSAVAGEPRQVRASIGLAGQHSAVDDDLTGHENLFILGLMWHLG